MEINIDIDEIAREVAESYEVISQVESIVDDKVGNLSVTDFSDFEYEVENIVDSKLYDFDTTIREIVDEKLGEFDPGVAQAAPSDAALAQRVAALEEQVGTLVHALESAAKLVGVLVKLNANG